MFFPLPRPPRQLATSSRGVSFLTHTRKNRKRLPVFAPATIQQTANGQFHGHAGTTTKNDKIMEKSNALTFAEPTGVVITGPCYFVPTDMWAESRYGASLPFPHITEDTGHGDWNARVVSQEDVAPLTFTADSGQCSAAALDDIMQAFPDAFKNIRRECYAVIDGFQGTVTFTRDDDGVLHVTGHGNINFDTEMD